jgi:hypothetical protein
MRATLAQHVRARDLANEAFFHVYSRLPSLGERQYLQAISCRESTYGAGWKGEGIGSNNQGAIQCSTPPPCDPAKCFETVDHHEDGSEYHWCYKKYPTALDGWIDLVKTLYISHDRDGIRVFANEFRFDLAAEEQRRTGYFEANLDAYRKGTDACLKELATALGEPYSPKVGGSPGSGESPPLVLPHTIQYGARGNIVKKWQLIVGTKPDGIFGPLTRQATTIYQVKHGLKADGIVGPKTWTVALS